MISSWMVYVILKLTIIHNFCFSVGILALGLSILMWVFGNLAESEGDIAVVAKFKRLSYPLALVFMPLAILIPTSEQAAAIYIVPKVATVENVEALEGEALELYGIAKEALIDLLVEKEASE